MARRGELTRAEVAADFDISEQSVSRWMRRADIDDGIKDGLTTAKQSEVVQLRRDKRRLEISEEPVTELGVVAVGVDQLVRQVRVVKVAVADRL